MWHFKVASIPWAARKLVRLELVDTRSDLASALVVEMPEATFAEALELFLKCEGEEVIAA